MFKRFPNASIYFLIFVVFSFEISLAQQAVEQQLTKTPYIPLSQEYGQNAAKNELHAKTQSKILQKDISNSASEQKQLILLLDDHLALLQSLRPIINSAKQSSTLNEWINNEYSPLSINSILQIYTESSICKAFASKYYEEYGVLEPYIDENFKRFDCMQKQNKNFIKWNHVNLKQLESNRKRAVYGQARLTRLVPVGSQRQTFFLGEKSVDVINGVPVYSRNLMDGSISDLGLKTGEIILTFDDGPHPTRSSAILKTLNQFEIKAVFFSLGKSILQNPKIAQEIVQSGNIYGSHSQTHANLIRLSKEAAQKEIAEGHRNMVSAVGVDSQFFRFPYGSFNNSLVQYLQQHSVSHFFWNIDSLDWKYANVGVLYENIIQEINREKKGVLLFHDIHEQTASVLPAILQELQAAGYGIYLAVPNSWQIPKP